MKHRSPVRKVSIIDCFLTRWFDIELPADVLVKNPKTTFVVIDKVDTDNWSIVGESIKARRQKLST
jgi:hypothetical protein